MAQGRIIIKGEDQLSSPLKKSQQSLTGFEQVSKQVGETLKKAFSVTAIVVGVKKLGDAAASCFKDFKEADRAYKQLSISLNDSKGFRAVTDNIKKLSKQTLSSKDQIEGMVAELAGLGKSSDEINKLSDAAVYLSNVTGKDLNSSMTTLLNTYNGTTTQLKKLGVDTSNLTKAELQNGAAVDLVIEKFKTLSEEMAANDNSQLITNIKNNIGDIKQSVGELVDTIIEPALKSIEQWAENFQIQFDNFIQNAKVVVTNLPTILNELWKTIKSALSNLFSIEGVKNFIKGVAKTIMSFNKTIITAILNLTNAFNNIITNALDGVKNYIMYWITGICDDIGLNLTDLVNSIGNWLNTSTIGKIIDNFISNIVNGIKLIGTLIRNLPEILKIVVKKSGELIGDFFKSIPSTLSNLFRGALKWVQAFGLSLKNTILQAVEDALNSIWSEVDEEPPKGTSAHKAWEKRQSEGKTRGVNFNVDTTMEEQLKLEASGYFSAASNAFSSVTEELAEMKSEINALLAPTIEKWAADSSETIGQKMAVWVANSEDYYKAAKKSFSNIGDYLDNWGETFSLDLEENWDELKTSFTGIFNSFGGDFDRFGEWLRVYIDNIRLNTAEIVEGTKENNKELKKLFDGNFIDNIGTKLGDWLNKITGKESGSTEGLTAGSTIINHAVDSLGEAGSVAKELSTNMATMGPLLGAIVTAIKHVLEGLGEVIRPVLDLITEYLSEPLREIGRVIGELIVPILEAIMPLFETTAKFLIGLFDSIGVVLKPIIGLLNTFLAPVIKVIANILNILTPVLKIFAKVLVTITGTIQYVVQILQHWVATLMDWLAGLNLLGWHPFGGLAMDDPGKPGSYTAYIKNKWGEIDDSFANAGTGINGTDSQTTTTVTNASYSGATNITLNVFQEGIVVGDGGITEFAQMLRGELLALDYMGR